jgi:hypothetical protein
VHGTLFVGDRMSMQENPRLIVQLPRSILASRLVVADWFQQGVVNAQN